MKTADKEIKRNNSKSSTAAITKVSAVKHEK